MRRKQVLLLISTLLAYCVVPNFDQAQSNETGSTSQAPANVAGTWLMKWWNGQWLTYALTIQQNGSSFKGTYIPAQGECTHIEGDCLLEGTITGNHVKLTLYYVNRNTRGQRWNIYLGSVTDDTMTSTSGDTVCCFGTNGVPRWSATRMTAEQVAQQVEKQRSEIRAKQQAKENQPVVEPNLPPEQDALWKEFAKDPRLQEFTSGAREGLLKLGVDSQEYCTTNVLLGTFYDCRCFAQSMVDARVKQGLDGGAAVPISAADAGLGQSVITYVSRLNDAAYAKCAAPSKIAAYETSKAKEVFSRDFSQDEAQTMSQCVGETVASRFAANPTANAEYTDRLFIDAVAGCRRASHSNGQYPTPVVRVDQQSSSSRSSSFPPPGGGVESRTSIPIEQSSPTTQQHPEISGTYRGEFRCALAKFDLALSVVFGQGNSLAAKFDFSPVFPQKSQQRFIYDLAGTYDLNTEKFQMNPVRWETAPLPGYQMTGIKGTFDPVAHRVDGRVDNLFCGGFHLNRDQASAHQ